MTLRRRWLIWGAIVLSAMPFVLAHEVATTKFKTRLTLHPGEEAELLVPSVLGHRVSVALEFKRGEVDKSRVLELGGSRCAEAPPGVPRCVDYPGLSILLEGSINREAPIQLKATKANYWSQKVGRGLVPAFGDNTPNSFVTFVAPVGFNRISIRVSSVAEALRGEEVDLIARPPVTLKTEQANYRPLLPGYFFSLLILFVSAIWGCILLFQTIRKSGA